VKRVYVVFKTHLDVGYTDLVPDVLGRYFSHFIPGAIALANRMREEAPESGMVWTTGAWLIYEYLEQAAPDERRAMARAIAAGDVAWHALPMTLHSELADADHFRYGLTLARQLDERFGRTTIAAKMTDVPGHTRAIVPLLHEAGIQFLHIGVNPASSAPEVPNLFRWRDQATDSEIVVAYTKGGYGNIVRQERGDAALFIAMTNDNHGPQTVGAVKALYAELRRSYPDANVRAGRMDDYARDLLPRRQSLPLVTQELGDTWIHGVGCDPHTTVPYRQLSRMRKAWVERGLHEQYPEAFGRFSRRLLHVPEHTWGLSEMASLSDYEHYRKEAFASRRHQDNYQRIERAWADKRAHNEEAIDLLDGTPMAAEARAAIEALAARRPDVARYERIDHARAMHETPLFRLRFSESGAITHLEAGESGCTWAGDSNPLGLFLYEVFSLEEFQRFHDAYAIIDVDWGRSDLGKVCLERAACNYQEAVGRHQEWTPALEALYRRESDQSIAFLACLSGPAEACQRFGCPRRIFTEFTFSKSAPVLHVDFQFLDKDASRIGEGLWLSFRPLVAHPAGWTLHKMGQAVSPRDIVPGGNQYLHAVHPGVTYRDEERTLEIESPDAALCAPGERALLRFDNTPPDLAQGVHFNLCNNVWGTNFRSWYDEDSRFRFTLKFA